MGPLVTRPLENGRVRWHFLALAPGPVRPARRGAHWGAAAGIAAPIMFRRPVQQMRQPQVHQERIVRRRAPPARPLKRLGGARRGPRLFGQHLVVAGGAGEPRGDPRSSLRGAAGRAAGLQDDAVRWALKAFSGHVGGHSPIDFLLPRGRKTCRTRRCAQSSSVPSAAAAKPACGHAPQRFTRAVSQCASRGNATSDEPRKDDRGERRARPGIRDPKACGRPEFYELPEQRGARPNPCSLLCYAEPYSVMVLGCVLAI